MDTDEHTVCFDCRVGNLEEEIEDTVAWLKKCQNEYVELTGKKFADTD